MNMNNLQRQKIRSLIGAVQRMQSSVRAELDRHHKLIEMQRNLQLKRETALQYKQDKEAELSTAHRDEWPEYIAKQDRHIAALDEEMDLLKIEDAEINKKIDEIRADLDSIQVVAESLMRRLDNNDPIRRLNDSVKGDHVVMVRG